MSQNNYDKFIDEETGSALSDVEWLDTHFFACQDGYKKCLDFVALAPGQRVLDAGCGTGAYIPWIADAIGASGRIVAVDHDAKNLDALAARLAKNPVATALETIQGDITELDFDGAFDVVWSANVTELLTDEQLDKALDVFYRAVVPGGQVAVKGFDAQTVRFCPELYERAYSALEPRVLDSTHAFKSLLYATRRHAAMRFWFARHGFEQVRQEIVLIDHATPWTPIQRKWTEEFLQLYADVAKDLPLPPDEAALWRNIENVSDPNHPMNAGDFLFAEGSAVTMGRRPA